MKTPIKFTSVVDSKSGRVWINHPASNKMELVANAKEDADLYGKWAFVIAKIRNSSPQKLASIMEIIKIVRKKDFSKP